MAKGVSNFYMAKGLETGWKWGKFQKEQNVVSGKLHKILSMNILLPTIDNNNNILE